MYVEPIKKLLRRLKYTCLGAIPEELHNGAKIFVCSINSRLGN